jgi:CxxC-x17-CxxC domain-containing protein
MNFQPKDGGFQGQRQMYQGHWKCSKCGADITELPFEPDPARLDRLLCRDCHRERVRKFRR